MSFLKNSQFIEKITSDCVSWNNLGLRYWKSEIEARRRNAFSLKATLKFIFAYAINPKLDTNKKKIFFFQGSRHSHYFQYLDKESICIIGRTDEKKFAKDNGFLFVSSLAITAAVTFSVYRGKHFLLKLVFTKWCKLLERLDSALFFIHEDTQPLGTFLNYLAKDNLTNSHAICIQHAFYAIYSYPLRLEGQNTEFNFTLSLKQAERLQLNLKKTMIINYPYRPSFKSNKIEQVILVGVGGVYYDNAIYLDSIKHFQRIAQIINELFDLTVLYRPHPNEQLFPEILEMLKNNFTIDALRPKERLTESRSIFIGIASSLLHEAELLSHPVAYFNGDHRQTAGLSASAKMLCIPNFDDLGGWIHDTLDSNDSEANNAYITKESSIPFLEAVQEVESICS